MPGASISDSLDVAILGRSGARTRGEHVSPDDANNAAQKPPTAAHEVCLSSPADPLTAPTSSDCAAGIAR